MTETKEDQMFEIISNKGRKFFDILLDQLKKFMEEEDFGNDENERVLVGSCTIGAINFLLNTIVTFAVNSDNPENVYKGFVETFDNLASVEFKRRMESKK